MSPRRPEPVRERAGEWLAAGGGVAAATASGSSQHDPLLDALQLVLSQHGIVRSRESLLAGLPVAGRLTPELFVSAAQAAGCEAASALRELREIGELLLPAVLELRDGSVVLLRARDADGRCEVVMPEAAAAPTWLAAAELEGRYAGRCYFVRPRPRGPARHDERRPAAHGHWFWGTLWNYRRYYAETAAAAVLVNVLTLAGTFFVMNVYDRVIANQAYFTLWTLASGVSIAIAFELVARCLRGWLIDTAGRKADLVLGSMLFRQALAMRLELRPASPGAFASQLREFEALRDFASSLTLVALTDLPFLLLFLAVIALIAGPLVWVPLALLPLIAAVTALAQPALARHVRENLRESAERQGLLVESLASAEAIKALRAEGLQQRRYEQASAATAVTAMKTRLLTQLVLNVCAALQSFATVAMIVWGSYLIADGRLTLGALIGAVMLCSRSLAPVGGMAGLAVRYQQARSALRTLDALMSKPTDRDPAREYLRVCAPRGALALRGLAFRYAPDTAPAVGPLDLQLAAGERVAILGRIGSGKSTLLRLLCGLYGPTEGQVLLDGLDLRQLDPADVRRHVLHVGQDAQLLHGTLRENLKAAAPQVGDERMVAVCRATGLDALAARDPRGYDLWVGEGGQGLSGGQRQLVALTRALLAEPAVLLLDEPTSAMDNATEQQALQAVMRIAAGRTIVLVTHKLQLLGHAERLVVLDSGRCVADGARQAVLQALAEGRIRAGAAAGTAS
ncbi:MAG: type I secretion system permease/ATPase [Steroidobacteraceae bacterium]